MIAGRPAPPRLGPPRRSAASMPLHKRNDYIPPWRQSGPVIYFISVATVKTLLLLFMTLILCLLRFSRAAILGRTKLLLVSTTVIYRKKRNLPRGNRDSFSYFVSLLV